MNGELQYRVEQFFYRNAEACDAQDWDAYLAMFSEDSEFHLRSGTRSTSTPLTQRKACR